MGRSYSHAREIAVDWDSGLRGTMHACMYCKPRWCCTTIFPDRGGWIRLDWEILVTMWLLIVDVRCSIQILALFMIAVGTMTMK